MLDSSQNQNEHEQQLDAIIARYYLATEPGQPPNQSGFVAQHPEFVQELRDFFRDLGHLERDFPPAEKDPALCDTMEMKPVRYFGQYEILGEVGSGGMNHFLFN